MSDSEYSPPPPISPVGGFVSYDIPLVSEIPYQQNKQSPSNQTTHFNNSAIDQEKNGGYEDNASSHGFFFGTQSTQDMSLWDANEEDFVDDEDNDDDEGISGIYGIYRHSKDQTMWMRDSNRSFKPSPELTPRHAISKRIGNVGVIGQNIALGHRLGVLSEDATLIPKSVFLQSTRFVISEDSPVQTDIVWSRPENASTFSTLIYNVEVSLPGNGDEWMEAASIRQPVFRVYHTDDKMFIGKNHVIRCGEDITIKVRVRCHGELVLPDRVQHWLASPYSKTVEVIFVGYVPLEVMQTDL